MTREITRFKSAEDMLSQIRDGNDFYCPDLELYVFVYNVDGSICSYRGIDKEWAERLDKEDEYWGAYLGWYGSAIWDSKEYIRKEYMRRKGIAKEDIEDEALLWCSYYYKNDWLNVTK